MSDLLVLNIQSAGASDVRKIDSHELNRTPDGSSAIDPVRSHLNELLHGPKSPSEALRQLWNRGVKKPDKQAEKPYLSIVIGASGSFFRPDDPEASGTWDDERVDAFKAKAMEWLRQQFGDDLVHVSLHLDEDTPHIHALVVPTYQQMPRRPRRRKRETDEEHKARVEEFESSDPQGVRTESRSSHPFLSRKDSFRTLRHSCADALADLGIEYGEDRQPDAIGHKSTRQWVAEQVVVARQRTAELDEREHRLNKAEAKTVAVSSALTALAREAVAGTIKKHEDGRISTAHPALFKAAMPEIAPALKIVLELAEQQRRARAQLSARAGELDERAAQLDRQAEEIVERQKQLNSLSDRLTSGLRVVGAALKFVAEKLGVRVSDRFQGALDDVQKALDEYGGASPRMRIAPVSAAPEQPREETGPGL